MNEVLKAARDRGVLIIHCPSDTMAYYEGTPQRKLAQSAPPVETKIPLQRWCFLDEKKEGLLPIDDTDGGCDTPADEQAAWAKKLEAITRLARIAAAPSVGLLLLRPPCVSRCRHPHRNGGSPKAAEHHPPLRNAPRT